MTAAARRRVAYCLSGGLILLGVLLPSGWYDALPTNPDVPPPPFRGITLFQALLVLQGVALGWLTYAGWTYERLAESQRLPLRSHPDDGSLGRRTALWLLAAISLLALFLRLHGLGADFWIDEVRATLDAKQMSALQVVGSYVRSNVHLLNTLLMKLSMSALGEAEWTARLPAALIGWATVPALYGVSRLALARGPSLGAALLLAVSYHHIFFSQNARGYIFYLFFSLVSSGLLVRGLQQDRGRIWALYVVTMVLNFASILISGFVFAGHVLIGAVALVWIKRSGRPAGPLLKRLVLVFGATALLGFQLYSVMLPSVISYIGATYSASVSGYSLVSSEFLREMVRGLSAGFGPGLLLGVVPFLVLGAVGFIEVMRRQWILASALSLPVLLTAILLVVRGLTASPRFFLLGLLIAIITAIQAIDSAVGLVGRRLGWEAGLQRRLMAGVTLVLCAMSAASLGRYYAVPKQSYRASLRYVVSARSPDDIVIAVQTTRRGYEYYGPRHGLSAGRDLFLVNSDQEFESAVAAHGAGGVIVVTSFPRALHLESPDLEARLTRGWEVARIFPAAIGDGQILVWQQRHGHGGSR